MNETNEEVKDCFERVAASIEVTIMHLGMNSESLLKSLWEDREELVKIEFLYSENGEHKIAISARRELDKAIEKLSKGNLRGGQVRLSRARHRLC